MSVLVSDPSLQYPRLLYSLLATETFELRRWIQAPEEMGKSTKKLFVEKSLLRVLWERDLFRDRTNLRSYQIWPLSPGVDRLESLFPVHRWCRQQLPNLYLQVLLPQIDLQHHVTAIRQIKHRFQFLRNISTNRSCSLKFVFRNYLGHGIHNPFAIELIYFFFGRK